MAIQQVTDEEAQLKRKARRRLIGAVALTTAVAVILPMVLDGDPKPAGVNIELVVPDKNEVSDFQPDPAAGAAQPPAPSVAASAVVEAAKPALIAPVAAASAVSPAQPQVTQPQTAQTSAAVVKPAPAEVKHNDAKPLAVPSPAPVQSATPPIKSSELTKVPEAAPSKAAVVESTSSTELHAKPESAKSVGSFYLQVGVFSNPDNAKDLASKLKKLGFVVVSEHMDTRTKIKVGPYSNREAADKARRKLEDQGLKSALVEVGKRG